MKKTVLQIAIEDIPDQRKKDMLTVKKWCKKHSYLYKIITSMNDWGISEKLTPRKWSDFERIRILSEQSFVCYIDWDVEIIDNSLELGDDPMISTYLEQFIYNASNTEIFAKLYAEMHRRRELSLENDSWKKQDSIIYPSWRNVKLNQNWLMKDQDKYLIHHWHTFNKS